MKRFLPVVFSALAALSFSQLTLAGGEGKGAGAGPTDNPNVTRDAHGREHVNKGKHYGQRDKQDESKSAPGSPAQRSQEQSSGAGSTSAPAASASPSAPAATDPAVASDSTSAARKGDSAPAQ
jgi:hypothetical protein